MNILKLFQIIVVFLILTASYAQFGPRQIIKEDAGTIRMVRTADFDADGDLDVVASAFDLIARYENLDGLGSFSDAIPIMEGKGQSFSLFPADFNSDGFMDLAVSFFDADEVQWFRNLGDGSFVSQLISFGLLRAGGVTSADLDGDNDLDLVLGVSNGSGLYWVENLNGMGSFGPRITIDASISQARTQALGDIDGDGDFDILTNSGGNTFISWFENVDGLGSFTNEHIVDAVGLYTNFIYLFDIDGDGDLDILSEKGDLVIWRENVDGLGNFLDYIIIGDDNINPSDAIAKDLDNDGDLDIVASFSTGNTVSWYQNDGAGGFGAQIVIDPDLQSPRTVHAADLDGDGDLDIVSAALSNNGRQLVWYENLNILGVEDSKVESISIYPNPVQNTLYVENKGNETIEALLIHDALGRLVMEQQGLIDEVDVSNLSAGLFVVRIKTEKGISSQKLIKE